MQYKGEDLDLRVPPGRVSRDLYASDLEQAPVNGRWSRKPTFGIGNSDPLWVDETLLACCNYAFDVAQANGAAEVDLEHLVNALTRVEAAARILESRGVREGYLRRESAALIASEVPAANAGEAVSPRRSADLEDILRHASDVAHRRGSPASVDDVLLVLLHYGRELPVVQLLRRLTPEWQRLDWGHVRESKLPEPVARPVAVQLVANDSVHARMAGVEDSLRLMQSEFASERKLMLDLARDIQHDLVAQRGDASTFRGDLGQRLESLERALTARSDPRTQTILADRLTRLEQAVQGSLTEALRNTREMAQRLGSIEIAVADARQGSETGPIGERMAALEKAVHNGLGEGARNWAHLGQRLNSMESVFADRGDGAGLAMIAERLSGLERVVEARLAEGARNFNQLGERLKAFEATTNGDGAARLIETLEPRLASIEHRLADRTDETERQKVDFLTRIETSGKALESNLLDAKRIQIDMADRLSAIETYMAEGPATVAGATPDLGEFPERLSSLESAVRSGFGGTAAAMNQMVQRLVSVERNAVDRSGDSDALLILEERIGALDSRGHQTLSAANAIVERLSTLEQRSSNEAGAVIDPTSVVAPIEQKLATLEESSVARVDQMREAVTAIATRLDQFDERMRADAVVTEEALRGRDQDFDFIYNEIKEVAQSQATLNSAVSDWRTESQEHFTALASRLDGLRAPMMARAATEAAPPPLVQITEPPSASKPKGANDIVLNGTAKKPDVIEVSVKADDYELPPQPGRGFMHWLFGTPSVATANRDNALKLGRMRDNIRETRERRRTEV